MTYTVTLFEHEIRYCDLTHQQLVLLDRLQHRMGTAVLQPVYRSGKWVIRAGQYVGVVRLGDQTIQVLPKIYRSPDTSSPAVLAREATANLLHMLAYAGFVQVRESDVADLLNRESDWFEILTYLFANHLRDAWRRGASRAYQSIDDELPLLKGRWRLSEQVHRPDKAHRFAVTYDEFTADIPLNRIFRFVVERLHRLTRSACNRRILGEVREMLDEVTLLPSVTSEETHRITFNRLTARYEPLLNLARLFLDKSALQTAHGDESLFAFVFDMNAVFEGFIAGFLNRHRSVTMPEELQTCTLAVQARGQQLHLAHSKGKPFFRLKPDLLFRQGTTAALIVDTKYKRLDPTDRKLGISEADFYQMFAYAQRYDCARVILLYPQSADMPAAMRRCFALEEQTTKQIIAATIDIRRDLGRRQDRDALAAELAAILSLR